MKKQINVFDYAKEIMEAVQTGVLLTTKVDDKVNSMTISWGTLGTVSYTHLRAHETGRNLVCRLLLEKKKKTNRKYT